MVNWFTNIRMVYKLGVLILIALVSLCAVGYTGYYYLQQANSQMAAMYRERFVPNDKITGSLAAVQANNSFVLELMLTTDVKKNQELKQEINDHTEIIDKNLAAVEKLPLDAKTVELLAKVKESRQRYIAARIEVLELAAQNKNAEAYAIYSSKVVALSTAYADNMAELSEYYTKLAEQMSNDNQASAAQATQITLGILGAAFLMLGLSGFFITKMITTPLQIMVSACTELASGDFRDKPRAVFRSDEIGQLADAMAAMRGSLRIVLKQVNDSAEQVAASSEELTASAEQSAQATTQVATTITEVAQGAEKQANAVDTTAAIVEQMSAGIQQVAANANAVSGMADKTTNAANQGDKAVDVAMSQMKSIENAVSSSAQVVVKLGDRSTEIGQIVDTISGIAGQTNLLALNAAIEAARAGEQGRGFAVVAEEVRKLAEQSQDAAKQIANLISEIQSETSNAVLAMNDGTREVKVGADVVNNAGKAFKEIVSLIGEVSSQVREISAAIQQMASGSQQIVASVRDIDRISKDAAGQTQTVSAATEEQSASMEEIAASSQELAKMAEQLQGAVRKFRV